MRRVLARPDMSERERKRLEDWLAEELEEPVRIVTEDDDG